MSDGAASDAQQRLMGLAIERAHEAEAHIAQGSSVT
jgi:hypothetical protein